MKTTTHKNQKGVILASVMLVMLLLMTLTTIVIQSVVQSQRNVTRHGYFLMARSAAKAAADFAKEKFENDENYNGTPENRNAPCSDIGVPAGCDPNSTVFYSSSSYSTVFTVEVVSTSADGRTKNIRAIGKIYIPDVAITAAYVQDIKTAIIRRGVVAGNPSDYSPVLWLDADDAPTLRTNATETTTYSQTVTIASTLEEKTNGTVASAVCQNSNEDLEMPAQGENTGNQYVGLRFAGLNIPQGATITNAYVQFKTNETKQAGTIGLTIDGLDVNNQGNFACNSNGQLDNASLTSASVNWNPSNWSTVGQSGSGQRTPALTAIVQEIVNRAGWASGNGLGVRFEKNGGGSGVRTANRGADINASDGNCTGCSVNDLTMYVEWQVSSTSEADATDGATVDKWLNKATEPSFVGQHLFRLSGTPRKLDNQLNSRPAVEFLTNGSATEEVIGNTTFTAMNGSAMTALAVMKPATSGGSSNDRYVVFVSSANANETNNPSSTNAVRVFYRSGSTNNMSTLARNLTPQNLSNVLSGSLASATWGIFSNRFSNTGLERFTRNGAPADFYDGGSSISYDVNQVFLGATTSAAANYTLPGDMLLSELVVYNKELSCEQIESIELYFQAKWNVTTDANNCTDGVPIAY